MSWYFYHSFEPAIVTIAATTVRLSYMTIYEPPRQGHLGYSGKYVATYAASGLSASFAKDTIFYIPIRFAYEQTFDRLSLYVDASGGANARIGVYPVERGVIGTKIYGSDSFSVASSGLKEVTVDIYLAAGIYVFAVLLDTITPLRINAIGQPLVPHGAGTEIVDNTHYTESLAFAALPTTPGTIALASGNCPRLWARMA